MFSFPTTSCSLSPGDHDRRFGVQFGVVLKLVAEIKMDKFPCKDHMFSVLVSNRSYAVCSLAVLIYHRRIIAERGPFA